MSDSESTEEPEYCGKCFKLLTLGNHDPEWRTDREGPICDDCWYCENCW